MSFKDRDCIASAWTSAGAFIVSTKPCKLVGISYLGSAAATTIVIKDGVNTAGRTVATLNIPITSGGFQTTLVPITCTSGIVATNAGTVAGYCVLYTNR